MTTLGLPEVLFVLIGILGTVFWIWMLVDAATKERDPQQRLIWVIIVVLTHVIGAAIYFFVRRAPRHRVA